MIRDILLSATKEMGLMLSDEIINSFELFASELKKWNRRLNLTTITNNHEIAIKHLVDSLHMAEYVCDEDSLLDLGSGAGLPVIPLKIIKPDTVMLSVDAVAKKIHFQRHVIRLLNLQGIEALHARVEDLPDQYANYFSIITSRAFTRLDNFVALAAPFLARGGRLIAMKGARVEEEIAACNNTLHELGFTVTAIHPYILPDNMGAHSLVEVMAREAAKNGH